MQIEIRVDASAGVDIWILTDRLMTGMVRPDPRFPVLRYL